MSETALPPRPSPRAEIELQRYWDASAEGRLVVGRCDDCERVYFPPQLACPRCWSSRTRVEPAAGTGVVEAVSVVHKHGVPAFKARLPYAIVLVRLDEGVSVTSTIVDMDAEAVRIGMRVRVAFEDSADGTAIPIFIAEEN